MNYKNLIIFVVVIGTILGISIGYLVYAVPIDRENTAKNHPLVINCVPVGPDGEIPAMGTIGNYTHIFDLRTCTWNEP